MSSRARQVSDHRGMNVESERDEVRAESNGAIGSAYDAKNEVERKERAEVHASYTPGHSDTKWSRQSRSESTSRMRANGSHGYCRTAQTGANARFLRAAAASSSCELPLTRAELSFSKDRTCSHDENLLVHFRLFYTHSSGFTFCMSRLPVEHLRHRVVGGPRARMNITTYVDRRTRIGPTDSHAA